MSHPHICTLHDIGHQDGIDYLVMEYLEGETLAARLTKGPLPLDQVLRYATEMADALDKAHRAGIAHRDLKPGNVMLTKAGAKLLDFGLAKPLGIPGLKPWATPVAMPGGVADAGHEAGPGVSTLPTKAASLTAKGVILGTLQYMAPEQLEGKAVDARTDLFALGMVIYEMATGQKAFTGDSQASLIAAILSATPPPISTLQPLTPPALDHGVQTCLAKDPDERWQSASDLKRELKWIAAQGSSAGLVAPIVVRRQRRARSAVIAGALLIGGIAIGVLTWNIARSTAPTLRPITRSVIPLPPPQAIDVLSPIAISPDGTLVVYNSEDRLYVRALDQLTATAIPGTEGAGVSFLSPDGKWLAFAAVDGTLKKVALTGGRPITICRAYLVAGASWGSGDTIVFNTAPGWGLSRVSAAGGQPQVLTRPNRDRREKTHRFPEVLPGGKAAIFTSATVDVASYDDARIEVLSLETGERRVLIEGGMHARYASSGHLVYARAGALSAVPFDLQRLEVTGTPVRILDGIATSPYDGAAGFAVSQAGSLVYVPGGVLKLHSTLQWVDRQGRAQLITDRRDDYHPQPRLSPDGLRLAVVLIRASNEIWILDFARDAFSRLAVGGDNNIPVWTPDGTRLIYNSNRTGVHNLYWQSADGSGSAEQLTTNANEQGPSSWSPDGKILTFNQHDPATGWDIWMLPIDGDRTPRPFLHERFDESLGKFSPDGRWLAYVSNETGRDEVYVRPYPGPGGKWQISNDGGSNPAWVRNGRELFYSSGDKLMSVGVTTGATFNVTKPRLLASQWHYESYDVSPDGQRFVVVSKGPGSQASQINLVLNWTEELKRKVPTK